MSGDSKLIGAATGTSHSAPNPITPHRPASRAAILSGSLDTPMSGSSHGSEFGYVTVEEQMKSVKAELSGHVYVDANLGKNAFVGKVPPKSEITEFLKKCSLYDNSKRRWRNIPEKAVQREEVLYDPINKILQAVVKHFRYSGSREIIDTHKVSYYHQEGSGDNDQTKTLKSSPDIFIKAKGSASKNFTFKPENRRKPDYHLCASPAEIKTQKNRSLFDNICQVAIYARQCFIQQHNRKVVYGLIITEKIVQLCMFDRSGVYHSRDINIHEHATDFVRLILGVVSPNEEVLGFDTTIFWDRKKKERYLTTVNDKKELVCYKLASTKPVFYRRAILGRGTCCWKGLDAKGNLLLVKDAWRSSGRVPETEFLDSVKGLAGVGQMIAFEERDHISSLRDIDMATIPENLRSAFRDRILTRITSKYGGKPIDMFDSAEEILYAFRDAVAGHRNLWKAKILHRDVSVNNILIGTNPTDVGNRGLIIDLDLAIWIDRITSLAGVDFRTGTRAFQSLNVLNSYDPKRSTVPHDYLDDLESFFYVLCWICCGHDKPKPHDKAHDHAHTKAEKVTSRKISPFPEFLTEWEDPAARAAANAKMGIYFDLHFIHPITSIFHDEAGPAFPSLLEKLFQFFKTHAVHKSSFPKDKPRPALMDLVPTAVEHYDTVLKIFDEAIDEYVAFKASAKERAVAALIPATPTKQHSMRLPLVDHPANGSTSPGSRSIRKRGSDSEFPLDDSPTAKKPRKDYKPPYPSSLSTSFSYDE